MTPTLHVLWEDWADRNLPLPGYETPGAAGADIRANLMPDDRAQGVTLAPMQRMVVPTGLRVEIPPGFEAQIRPRSGLAMKHGITVPNTPGTIDSDYRGPLGVALINLCGIGSAGVMQVVTGRIHTALTPTEGLVNSAPPATPYMGLFLFYTVFVTIGLALYLLSKDRTD